MKLATMLTNSESTIWQDRLNEWVITFKNGSSMIVSALSFKDAVRAAFEKKGSGNDSLIVSICRKKDIDKH